MAMMAYYVIIVVVMFEQTFVGSNKTPQVETTTTDSRGLIGTPPQNFSFPSFQMSTTEKIKDPTSRTTPYRVILEETCDYIAFYCLRAYKTGIVCGRTIYYNYRTFKNYCMLDYVNCMERYEVWQVVHMGECFNVTVIEDPAEYEIGDDTFLDQTYVLLS